MPALEEIPFTSLASRQDSQRIPFELAYKADDLYTDTDAITGRSGSRSALAAAIALSSTVVNITNLTEHDPLEGIAGWNKNSASTSRMISFLMGTSPEPVACGPSRDGLVAMYYRDEVPVAFPYTVEAPFWFFLGNHSGGHMYVGLAGQMLTNALTGYVAYYEDTDSNNLGVGWTLSKFVGGTETVLATFSAQEGNVPQHQKTAKLVLDSGSQKVYVDDVLIMSATDTAITAIGKVGYYSKNSGTPGFGPMGLTVTQLTPGTTPQWIDRFRPDTLSARTVVVIGGGVFVVTDPSSETASDATAVLLGVPFSDTAIISGAALNNSYYLSTDQAATPWVRINWTSPDTYTLETLSAIPQGAKPTAVVTSALTWTAFSGLTQSQSGCVSQDNSKSAFTSMASTWRGFSLTDNGGNDPLTGAYTRYKLPADFDASTYDWAAIALSPHDGSPDGTPYTLTVQVAKDNAGSPDTFYDIGSIWDIPPVADSPNLLFCDIRTLLSTVRSAIRWIQIIITGNSGGKFITYGYMFLPATPIANPAHFFVDFENVSTGEFSTLTEELDVTIPQATVAQYPDSRMGNNVAHSSGGQDDPFSNSNLRVFNPAGAGGPSLAQIGGIVTITGTAPTFSTPASLLARLWEDTDNGRRLVSSQTVTSGQAYTFNVGGGVSILANQLYKAGGLPPRAVSITAKDQRLIAVYQNRRYISSFVPTSDTSNPFPQWPDIALEDADGWSADFYPNKREQGQVVFGNADALYLVSNESWYYMFDLTPNSPSFRVFGRGALGHSGGKWFEDRFFVASWDGVYEGVSRANPIEMTEVVRRIYNEWLTPSSAVCIGYDPAKRALFIFEGRKFMRYRFPLQDQPGKWTRGTLAQTVKFAAVWNGLVHYGAGTTSVDPQFWLLDSDLFLDRVQASADRDVMIGTDEATGTAIPDWVYSTGFATTPAPAVVKGLLADPSANGLTATIAKTIAASGSQEARSQTFSVVAHQDELWEPGFGDLKGQKFRVEFTAANTVSLRRAAWERELLNEPKGG